MSQVAPDAKAIRAQIDTDIKTAWPDILSIEENNPRLPNLKVPYAVRKLASVDMAFNGGVTKKHTLSYQILGRFPWPTTGTYEDAKLDRGQALMDLLEANSTYANVGLLPIVSSLDFAEVDSLTEHAYEVLIVFDVLTDRPHGSANI